MLIVDDDVEQFPNADFSSIQAAVLAAPHAEHDCHDDSAGPHTPPALVADQWINDFGRTENRPGLCKHATLTP